MEQLSHLIALDSEQGISNYGTRLRTLKSGGSVSSDVAEVLKELGAVQKVIALEINTLSGPIRITGTLAKITEGGLLISCQDEDRYITCSQIVSFEIARDQEQPPNERLNTKDDANQIPTVHEGADSTVPNAVPDEEANADGQQKRQLCAYVNGKIIKTITTISTDLDSKADGNEFSNEFLDFVDPPSVRLPPPNFSLPDLGKDEQQELNRWLNRYTYATKVREMQRMLQDIPAIERLGDSLQDGRLYLLAALLAYGSGDNNRMNICFGKALSLKSIDAAIAWAAVKLQAQEYSDAAHIILHAIHFERNGIEQQQHLVKQLGRTVYRLSDREVRGLATIRNAAISSELLPEIDRVIALSLAKTYPDAAKAVLSSEYARAQELAQDSCVFYPPEDAHWILPMQQHLPITHTSPVEREWQQRLFGHISAYYVDRSYGFLLDDIRQTIYYFHEKDISDTSLLNTLKDNQIGQQVTFSPASRISTTSSYDRAQDLQLSTDSLVGDRSPATGIPVVHKGKLYWGVPRGSSFYARAKRAEREGKLEEAQTLYEGEIQNRGEFLESAIKDLSSLLMRRGNVDGALSILQNNRREFTDPIRIDTMRASFLMQAHRFVEAAHIFSLLRKKSTNKKQRLTFGRKEGFCYYASDSFAKSLEVLNALGKQFPGDTSTHQLIERVRQKQMGESVPSDDLVVTTLELTGPHYGPSAFARFALDNCDFVGLDERSKAREFFEEKDFIVLDALVEKNRGRRPKEKAALLLSLAAMCELQPETAGNRDMRNYLRRYFINMAEASIHDGLHPDITRAYVAECLLQSPSLERRTQPVCLLLATYLSQRLGPSELYAPISVIMKKLVADGAGWKRFIDDFPYFTYMSSSLGEFLQKELNKEKPFEKLHQLSEGLETRQQNEYERCRTEKNQLEALIKVPPSIGYFEDLSATLLSAAQGTRFELDEQRLKESARLVSDAAACWIEKDFVEREAKHLRLENALTSFRENVSRGPTRLSIEVLLPLCERIQEELQKYVFESRKSAEPQVELSNVLSNEYCIPDAGGYVHISLDLRSKLGGAPIEGVDLQVLEEDGLISPEPVYSPEVLKGGDQRELEVLVKPSDSQIADEVFTLRVALRYHNRYGNSQHRETYGIPVRIGKSEAFEEIPNPYAAYSGGTVVNNRAMFFGREELVNKMIREITQGENGQCFVLYGQKRSGKSSVLAQVHSRLMKPYLPVSVTVGTLDTCNAETSFTQTCIDELEDSLMKTLGILPDNWPTREEIATYPIDSFKRSIKFSQSALESHGWGNPRIILLVDEFTYLFEYIREKMISPHFMRNWKALLERKMFNAVVVGQDSMPKFKQAFPNEFGVTHDERLTYLSEDDATQLAVEPILLEGKSRYRGRSLSRLLELSAGSPFYLQILCDHLVTHLNRKRAPFITEADIENVLRGLTSESGYLSEDKFDPLITAAGESVAEASREQYIETLSAIAHFSSPRAGAWMRDLEHLPDLQRLIEDMKDREVISIDAAGRISIRVGLFATWLKCNRPYLLKANLTMVTA